MHGKFHRDGDLPAVEWDDGGKEWYQNGKIHREKDDPAIIRSNGDKEWWVNGRFKKRSRCRRIIR